MEDCPQNFIVALEASVLGQLFIYRDIFQHRALSPARRPKGLFTNYSESLQRDIRMSPAREVKMSHKRKILISWKCWKVVVVSHFTKAEDLFP